MSTAIRSRRWVGCLGRAVPSGGPQKLKTMALRTHSLDPMVGQTEIFKSLSHALPLIPRSRTQLWAFQNT